MNVTYVMVKR